MIITKEFLKECLEHDKCYINKKIIPYIPLETEGDQRRAMIMMLKIYGNDSEFFKGLRHEKIGPMLFKFLKNNHLVNITFTHKELGEGYYNLFISKNRNFNSLNFNSLVDLRYHFVRKLIQKHGREIDDADVIRDKEIVRNGKIKIEPVTRYLDYIPLRALIDCDNEMFKKTKFSSGSVCIFLPHGHLGHLIKFSDEDDPWCTMKCKECNKLHF